MGFDAVTTVIFEIKLISRAHNFASVEQGLATTRETIANLLCEQPKMPILRIGHNRAI